MRVPSEDDEPAAPRKRLKRRVVAYGEDEDREDSRGFGLPEVMYLLSVVLILGAPLVFGTWRGMVAGAMLAGALLMIVGFYGAMIAARGAEIWERIVYVLFPLYHFYFWAKFWDDTKRYVGCCGVGFVLWIVSFGMIGVVAAQQRQQREAVAAQQRAAATEQRDRFHQENTQRMLNQMNASIPRGVPNPSHHIPGVPET